jgi:hypothetical protein
MCGSCLQGIVCDGGKERDGDETSWFVNDMRENIKKCKKYVDDANKRVGRTGADALGWGNGEYNANPGRCGTFENGQMHAMVLGFIMKHEGTYACAWNMVRRLSDKPSFSPQI